MSDERTARPANAADVVLAGGGLANLLIAFRLKARRPDLRLLVIDREPRLGGNHTWSFHDTDVTPEQRLALAPLIVASWPRQEVRFPSHARVLATGYNTIISERLHEVATATLGHDLMLGTAIADVRPDRVRLADGTEIAAPLVIDGRGALSEQPLALGYQKFVGLEVETRAPHGLAHPIIMDATVPQIDGYRFVYSLPFTPRRILIEDTYYSDTPTLDHEALAERIRAYARARGWSIERVVRSEAAVLPITLAGDIDRHWQALGSLIPQVGLRAWLFHPTTGYSLPYAARVADLIVSLPELTSAAVAREIERHSRSAWESQAFFRLLNRMLFVAARPEQRVRILDRFYTLPEPLVQRFYAGQLTASDCARILIGKPPISVWEALKGFDERAAWRFAAAHPPARALG